MSTLFNRLTNFNYGLLPEMLQIKYEAMAENAFRFFRGTCHLFYEDLSFARPLPLSPLVWICGDLHIENFGSYKGDNKLVYFDLNDFDEAVLAPASYEVARMVTSIFIAFDNLEIEDAKALNMAKLFLKTYSATLTKGKAISIEPRTAKKGIVCEFLTADTKSSKKELLKKRTVSKKKRIMLSLEDERHYKLDKKLRHELKSHIDEWTKTSSDGPYNYEVISTVFRIAGTGSLGIKRYLFPLKSTNTKNKYLLLDMKQARKSSLSPYLPVQQLSWDSEAARVIGVQQRMQNVPAALLSTTTFRGESYIIQELQPVKDTIKFNQLKDYRDIYRVIDDMAALTASAELRSGGMQGSGTIDELMAFGTDQGWQDTVIDYAQIYAETIRQYHSIYQKDYKTGKYGSKL
ncbi:DUF2252 domain-containing protein [Mucilaginibacter sp.]|uniref:DUF2252 domain-containing protein n=1 Tax=Mucilaginibacter sp. TaxID=1882438 RepID=UPI003D135C17